MKDLEKIILIYMHREISGLEALKNTTLKSLGLVNGKAVLRLIQKRPQSIDTNETIRMYDSTGKQTQKLRELKNMFSERREKNNEKRI